MEEHNLHISQGGGLMSKEDMNEARALERDCASGVLRGWIVSCTQRWINTPENMNRPEKQRLDEWAMDILVPGEKSKEILKGEEVHVHEWEDGIDGRLKIDVKICKTCGFIHYHYVNKKKLDALRFGGSVCRWTGDEDTGKAMERAGEGLAEERSRRGRFALQCNLAANILRSHGHHRAAVSFSKTANVFLASLDAWEEAQLRMAWLNEKGTMVPEEAAKAAEQG